MLRNILPDSRCSASDGMDSRLEKLSSAVTAAIADLSSEELSWHPSGKWCAAEILEHLYLTYTGTSKGIERTLSSGQLFVTADSMRLRARRFIVLGLSYLPSGRESPPVARPKGLPSETVRSEFAAQIRRMDSLLAECESRFGKIAILDHPILGPLTAAQWRKFHYLHGRHHERQILGLRQKLRAQKS